LLVSAALAAAVAAATATLVVARHERRARDDAPATTKETTKETSIVARCGESIDGRLADARGARAVYAFDVPDDAVQADVSLTGDGDAVEFRAACADDAPARDGEWPWRSREDDDREKLSLTRHGDREFRPGKLFVEVRPTSGAGRRDEKRTLAFRLRADLARLAAPRAIAAGRGVDGATSPQNGHRADFVVDVPAGTNRVRVDLVEAERDLDLLASSAGPALDVDDAQWKATTSLSHESLVIDSKSDAPPPAGGKLWIGVVDPSTYDAPVSFRVAVAFDADEPAESSPIPEIPTPTDPRERAVASVVEIVVDDGAGSGTIVRADGLVLTARHVIGDRTGEGTRPIVVAMDLDPTRITRELFRAKLVKSDEALDLALLQISADVHGRPLAKALHLPACPVAFDAAPRLGDPLVTIGFPEPAGTGTRAPVMYSRGVVAGFEREKSGVRMKTDAFVASGSSGGAALDAEFRLIGVPVFVVGESEGTAQTGYLVPTSELRKDWRELIAASPR